MQIKLKRIDGCCDSVEVSSSDILVSEFKKIVEDKLHVAVDRIRLISGGIVLKDADSLRNYSIRDDSVIHVVIRPEGIPASQSAPRQAPPLVPNMQTQTLGNGVVMSSVTLDGNSGVNIPEIISQMMGMAHNVATNVATSTSPGLNQHSVTDRPSHDSDIMMSSAFLTALDRNATSSQQRHVTPQQGDSLASLLHQLMHTLHALQMPVLTLSQQLAERERSPTTGGGISLQTDVVEMASMLRNLSLGASHAAAALEGFRVTQQMGAGARHSSPAASAAPRPHPQQPSRSAVPPGGGVPPSGQPSLTVRVQRTPRPTAAAEPRTTSSPTTQLPIPSTSQTGGQGQPQLDVANIIGSVISGVQSIQNGQGIPGLLASVMQLASPSQQQQQQPQPQPHPSPSHSAPTPGFTPGVPSRSDIGDIDSGDFDLTCAHSVRLISPPPAAAAAPPSASVSAEERDRTRSDSIDDLLEGTSVSEEIE